MTINTSEQQAQSQLGSGHYKEAIRLYKKLWAETDDKKYQQQLAFCYLQRALSFASRGMAKEALVLWGNYTQYTEPPYAAYDHYILCLILTKEQNKLQTALNELSAEQLDKQYPELSSLLGLLILTEQPELQQYLPQSSVLITQLEIIKTALQHYQDNKRDELNNDLKSIPYRSAFKDLRTLLNAVQLIPEETSQAQKLLTKIPDNSIYSQAANLLLSFTLEGQELLDKLATLSNKQRKLITKLKGFNKEQIQFIDYLIQHKDRLNDKIKFNVAIKYQSLWDSDFIQQFCQALLAHYPAGRRDFNKYFTRPGVFEENRIKALVYESKDNTYAAEEHWLNCIDALKAEENPDNHLKIAFIQRHIAKQQPSSEESTQLIIDSLEYDPEDLSSYKQILHDLSQYDEDIKEYKSWLKKALEKFPDNIDILTQAINTAMDNKANKKACQFALKILKQDPLNTFAKDVLFTSHLAHARVLITSKKYHLVDNEINQAEALKLGKHYLSQTQLLRGILCFVSEGKEKGLKYIAEALNHQHLDPVNAYFQVAMEALLANLPYTSILKVLIPVKGYLLSEQELKRVIQQLEYYGKDKSIEPLLHKALDKIKPALKISLAEQSYTEDLFLSLTEALDKHNAFQLLRYCSKQALDRWNKPIWHYYQAYSNCNGEPESCNYNFILRLEKAQQQTSEDKDKRASLLIKPFLDDYYYAHPQRSMDFLDKLFGFAEEEDEEYLFDPMESLFGHLSESVVGKMGRQAETIAKNTSPERLLKDVVNGAVSIEKVMSALMRNPNLLTALAFLKAADNLNIDININISDVLDAFNVNQSNKCPF